MTVLLIFGWILCGKTSLGMFALNDPGTLIREKTIHQELYQIQPCKWYELFPRIHIVLGLGLYYTLNGIDCVVVMKITD